MKWYSKYLQVYNKPFSEAPQELVSEIRSNLHKLQSEKPLATISLIAYNEEKHLLGSLWSLSEMQCKYPIEFIGVDNNSTDRTAEIFEATGITYYKEQQQGYGHARQCGLNNARGKYHINVDSDTMYPPHYVETMIDMLERPGVVAVNSSWNYIPDKDHSWLGLKFYEIARDTYLFLQSIKRPELSVRGFVFAFHTDYGKKVGIRTEIIRGEDGALAFQLKKYGKIAFIYKRKARAATECRSLVADGSFFNSFKVRVFKVLKNISAFFTKKVEYKDEKDNLQ